MSGQDRDSHQGGGSGRGGGGGGAGGTGGGSAGGSAKQGINLNFQRQVPKFLQKYEHMLGGRGGGGGGADEDEPTVDDRAGFGEGGFAERDVPKSLLARKRGGGGGGEGFDGWEDEEGCGGRRGKGGGDLRDDDVESDALKRAMADNPELAKEFEETLNKRISQAEAAEEKSKGNKLFSEKKYAEAVAAFTKCIERDPSDAVFYSNRSAAHAGLGAWEESLVDARKAAALKPAWGKAHQRMGAAFLALHLYSEAKDAYIKAAKLEPDNQAIQQALQRAEMGELQNVRDNKHVFKKARIAEAVSKAAVKAGAGGGGGKGRGESRPGTGAGGGSSAGAGGAAKKTLLSFGDDEDEG
ncbi:hypothetical protein FOA52_015793 [Chlamydomonas sp. UWO 241]|nr:hypothetical protein FOA52_015793 [Chlamydomonas sp. UWO 241]